MQPFGTGRLFSTCGSIVGCPRNGKCIAGNARRPGVTQNGSPSLRTRPRATDRQIYTIGCRPHLGLDSRIAHPHIFQAVAADVTAGSERTAFPLAQALWS